MLLVTGEVLRFADYRGVGAGCLGGFAWLVEGVLGLVSPSLILNLSIGLETW